VLAGGERGFGQRPVQVIGGADVHDVDIRGLDELLSRREGAFSAESRRRAFAALGRGRGDADQASTRDTRRPSVDSTNETRPGDGDANLSSKHGAAR
jgi:hypothetical protein